VKRWLADINECIFGFASPVALGVFRIVFGCVALLNWVMILPQFESWFSEKGYVPRAVAARWNGPEWRWNPFMWIQSDALVYGWYLLMIAFAIMVVLGLLTRFSTVMLALLTVAFHTRNPIILHGGDSLHRNMVILLALAPCGAAVSLDRYFAVKAGRAPAQPPLISIWPQRMMQWQLAVLYITTVWGKSLGNLWVEGKATWFPPQLSEFNRFYTPAFFDSKPMIYFSTYATLIIELALGTLVFWKPARKYCVIAGIGLHLSIEYRFNIPLFAFIILSCYVVYYSGEEWVALWERIKKARGWGQTIEEAQVTP
jgi:uncharacterized membrane protein YphA (DoxX/SURF4 family)